MSKKTTRPASFFPSSDVFDSSNFPLYWVAVVNEKYSMEMGKRLKGAGLDVARWRIAMLLRQHDELCISDLATHSVRKLPTVTKIVYKMRDEELVDVFPSEEDGRLTMVKLTDKGHNVINVILEDTQRFFHRIFEGFTESQISKLNQSLETLFNNLDNN